MTVNWTDMQIAELLMETINSSSVQLLTINEMQRLSNNFQKITILYFWVERGPDWARLELSDTCRADITQQTTDRIK